MSRIGFGYLCDLVRIKALDGMASLDIERTDVVDKDSEGAVRFVAQLSNWSFTSLKVHKYVITICDHVVCDFYMFFKVAFIEFLGRQQACLCVSNAIV